MVILPPPKPKMSDHQDHSGPNQFSTSCTDQEYLVLRSKEALARGNTWEAKTWMLTAKAIFPENFSIQFEAYCSERKERNVKESAKCIQSLFQKFPEEPRYHQPPHWFPRQQKTDQSNGNQPSG